MRTLIYLLTASVLLLASVTLWNSARESAPARPANATAGKVKTHYDRVTDATTAEVTVLLPGEGLDGFVCRALYRYTGAELEAHAAAVRAEEASWLRRLRSPDFSGFPKIKFALLARAGGKKFAETDRLSFLIDGERWEPKFEYKYSVDWKTTGNTFEEINTTATAARLREIADARKVVVTLGQMQFELTDQQRAPLGELAARALRLQRGAP